MENKEDWKLTEAKKILSKALEQNPEDSVVSEALQELEPWGRDENIISIDTLWEYVLAHTHNKVVVLAATQAWAVDDWVLAFWLARAFKFSRRAQ